MLSLSFAFNNYYDDAWKFLIVGLQYFYNNYESFSM